jgi:hypothetical protein
MRGIRLGLSVVAGLAVAAVVARADSSVRIVRLSLVVGAVEVNLPDGHGWRPAMLNLPLVEGEQVRTLDSGRAEIQFEGGSTLRLIPDSTVAMTRLVTSDSGVFRTTARLEAGTAFLTLRKSDAKDFALLTADGQSLQPDGAAAFRVSGAGAVQVLDGKLKQRGAAGGEQTLAPVAAAPAADPWTQWSQERDKYYALAFHAGVGGNAAATLVNWWAKTGAAMPSYDGVGLTYTADSACPWTESSGDYKGWCWTDNRGWFRPATPPVVTAAAAQSASDVSQTNGVLHSTLHATVAQAGGFGFANCPDPALMQYGWNLCSGMGMTSSFMDPALLSFSESQDGGGYIPLTVTTANTVRPVHRGPHPSRRLGNDGEPSQARLQRLGPPPRPRASTAGYAPAFHPAPPSGGTGVSVATHASPGQASPAPAAHVSAPHTVH